VSRGSRNRSRSSGEGQRGGRTQREDTDKERRGTEEKKGTGTGRGTGMESLTPPVVWREVEAGQEQGKAGGLFYTGKPHSHSHSQGQGQSERGLFPAVVVP